MRRLRISQGLGQTNREEEAWSTGSTARRWTSSSADRSSSSSRPPIPKLLADVVELRLRHESVSREEVHALWLGAGLATHVGLSIFEEPERFVIAAPSPVTPAAALAA